MVVVEPATSQLLQTLARHRHPVTRTAWPTSTNRGSKIFSSFPFFIFFAADATAAAADDDDAAAAGAATAAVSKAALQYMQGAGKLIFTHHECYRRTLSINNQLIAC